MCAAHALCLALIALCGFFEINQAQISVHIIRGSGFYISDCDTKYEPVFPTKHENVHFSGCVPVNGSFADDILKHSIEVASVVEFSLQQTPNVPQLQASHFIGLSPRKLIIEADYFKTALTPNKNFLEPLTSLIEVDFTRVLLPPFPLHSSILKATLQQGNSTGEFGGCKKLETLKVFSWQLAKLEKSWLAHCSNLKQIVLSSMPLENVTQALMGVQTVVSLSIHNLNVPELPNDMFNGMTKLRQLLLSNNKLQSLHRDTFMTQSMLEELDLSNNELSILRMDDSLVPLRSLIYLNLDSNPITNANDRKNCSQQMFFGNTTPPIGLVSLHETGFDKSCTGQLLGNKTSENKLHALEVLFSVPGRSLRLENYPVKCDCENVRLVNILQNHIMQVEDYQRLTCQDSGKPLHSISTNTLCRTPNKKILLIAGTIGSILVFLVTAALGIYCYMRR